MEEAIAKLRYERFHHPHPRVERKMETLLLKSDGLASGSISRNAPASGFWGGPNGRFDTTGG
jgi:hypothetical protein